MKGIRKLMDRIKPSFEKGGRFEKLHSTFDAFETFLFVPDHVTRNGSHIRDSIDLKRVMIVVVIALMPALLFGMYNTGLQHFRATGVADASLWTCFGFGFWKVLPIIVVSYVVGLGIEFVSAQIRGHEVNEGFLVSGLLIPLVMPVDVPLWMVAVGAAGAIGVGKMTFGGLGKNPFNPALVGRVFMLLSFPVAMTTFPAIDAATGATPLSAVKDMLASGMSVPEVMRMIDWSDLWFGFRSGSFGEVSSLALLLGGAWLLYRRVITWHIPVAVLGSMALFTGVLWLCNPDQFMSPLFHLLTGGALLGAIFMATDYVTSPMTPRGMVIYGGGIGVITVLIRLWGQYPEGMSFAILIMNAFVPLIDKYVRPRRFGVPSKA